LKKTHFPNVELPAKDSKKTNIQQRFGPVVKENLC